MVVGLILDIEWIEFVVAMDMVAIETYKIVVEREKVVVDMAVENIIVEVYREVSFHKWVLANPVYGVGFGHDEKTMPAKS